MKAVAGCRALDGLAGDRGAKVPEEDIILLGRLFASHGLSVGIERAAQLLQRVGGLNAALAAAPSKLRQAGARAEEIRLLLIVRQTMLRALRLDTDDRPVIRNLQTLLDYLHLDMANRSVEVFRVLFLDGRNCLIHDEIMHAGTLSSVEVHARPVLKRALELDAAALILCHNHPSGDHSPSRDDIRLTRNIVQAATEMRIAVHDHLIISRNGYTSMRDRGVM